MAFWCSVLAMLRGAHDDRDGVALARVAADVIVSDAHFPSTAVEVYMPEAAAALVSHNTCVLHYPDSFGRTTQKLPCRPPPPSVEGKHNHETKLQNRSPEMGYCSDLA